MALGACSPSGPWEPAPGAPDGLGAPTAERLRSALLEFEDLPVGWEVVPAGESPSAAFLDEGNGGHPCTRSVIDPDRVFARAEVRFARDAGSGQLLQLLVSYEDRHSATEAFRAIRDQIRRCTEWEVGNSGVAERFTTRSMRLPRLGDQSVATRVTAQAVPRSTDGTQTPDLAPLPVLAVDVVVVRKDQVVSFLAHLGTGPPDLDLVDSGETRAIASLAVQRMEGLR